MGGCAINDEIDLFYISATEQGMKMGVALVFEVFILYQLRPSTFSALVPLKIDVIARVILF